MKILISSLSVVMCLIPLVQESSEPSLDWRELALDPATTLRYVVHTPTDFNAEETHPFLLVFPPGDQSAELTEWAVRYFAEDADQNGWVLVVPSAINGVGWWKGSEEHIHALRQQLESEFAIEYGSFHVAGISNGGRSAIRVVGLFPEIAHSLTVLPGMPAEGPDWERLQNLAHLPISMYVGEDDEAWVEGARRMESELGRMGAPDVRLSVVPGAGHVLSSEIVSSVFDDLGRARARTEKEESAREAVAIVLDGLHEAAAVADEERYFGSFAPAATFIGTDAKERWSLSEFREYAEESFQGESAWVYTPLERHIAFSPDFRTAWFDERLMNEKYGETRGSGVLMEVGGTWRVVHYVLSFVIPNENVGEIVKIVRKPEAK